MRRVLPIALLLYASQAWGVPANHYVDCGAAAGGDGTLATPWDAIADVNGATFEAGDNVLFIRDCTWAEAMLFPSSGSAGNPITISAYGSGAQPIIDATGLDYAFAVQGKSYLILDGFDIRGGTVTFSPVFIYQNSNNNIIRNNTVRHSNSDPYPAVFVYDSSNNVADNNVVDNTYMGIGATRSTAGTADNNTISNNTVTGSIKYAIIVNADDAGFAGATNTIVERNTAHDNKGTDDTAAIGAYNPGAGTIFRYNLSYNNGDATHRYTGFWVDGDGNAAATTFSYNIAYGNSKEGFAATDNVAHKFYNNVSYHNCTIDNTTNGEINLFTVDEAPEGYIIKNNVFVASDNRQLLTTPVGGTTGHTIDYNLWYGGSATPFTWGGADNTFANYKTISSQDAHSVNADPLFVSTVTPDYRLQNGSPAINKGVSVGLTVDYSGNPLRGLPDIGAYEWQGGKFPSFPDFTTFPGMR